MDYQQQFFDDPAIAQKTQNINSLYHEQFFFQNLDKLIENEHKQLDEVHNEYIPSEQSSATVHINSSEQQERPKNQLDLIRDLASKIITQLQLTSDTFPSDPNIPSFDMKTYEETQRQEQLLLNDFTLTSHAEFARHYRYLSAQKSKELPTFFSELKDMSIRVLPDLTAIISATTLLTNFEEIRKTIPTFSYMSRSQVWFKLFFFSKELVQMIQNIVDGKDIKKEVKSFGRTVVDLSCTIVTVSFLGAYIPIGYGLVEIVSTATGFGIKAILHLNEDKIDLLEAREHQLKLEEQERSKIILSALKQGKTIEEAEKIYEDEQNKIFNLKTKKRIIQGMAMYAISNSIVTGFAMEFSRMTKTDNWLLGIYKDKVIEPVLQYLKNKALSHAFYQIIYKMLIKHIKLREILDKTFLKISDKIPEKYKSYIKRSKLLTWFTQIVFNELLKSFIIQKTQDLMIAGGNGELIYDFWEVMANIKNLPTQIIDSVPKNLSLYDIPKLYEYIHNEISIKIKNGETSFKKLLNIEWGEKYKKYTKKIYNIYKETTKNIYNVDSIIETSNTEYNINKLEEQQHHLKDGERLIENTVLKHATELRDELSEQRKKIVKQLELLNANINTTGEKIKNLRNAYKLQKIKTKPTKKSLEIPFNTKELKQQGKVLAKKIKKTSIKTRGDLETIIQYHNKMMVNKGRLESEFKRLRDNYSIISKIVANTRGQKQISKATSIHYQIMLLKTKKDMIEVQQIMTEIQKFSAVAYSTIDSLYQAITTRVDMSQLYSELDLIVHDEQIIQFLQNQNNILNKLGFKEETITKLKQLQEKNTEKNDYSLEEIDAFIQFMKLMNKKTTIQHSDGKTTNLQSCLTNPQDTNCYNKSVAKHATEFAIKAFVADFGTSIGFKYGYEAMGALELVLQSGTLDNWALDTVRQEFFESLGSYGVPVNEIMEYWYAYQRFGTYNTARVQMDTLMTSINSFNLIMKYFKGTGGWYERAKVTFKVISQLPKRMLVGDDGIKYVDAFFNNAHHLSLIP